MSLLLLGPAQTRRQHLAGCLFVLLAAFGFSAKAVLVKLAYGYDHQLDAITLMLLRMSISLPFFLCASLWSAKSPQNNNQQSLILRDWLMVIGLGALGYYLSSMLDFSGLVYISAGLERLILFLYPTFVVLLTALFFRQPVNRRQIVALLMTYAGMVLVFFDHNGKLRSIDIILGSSLVAGRALTFALFLIGSGVLIKRIGSMRFTAYSMTVACFVTCLHFMVSHGFAALKLPINVYFLAVIMAIFSTVLPAFLMNAGIQRIGAGLTAIISSTGPVITLFLAFFLLGEKLTALQLAGTLVVLIGVYVVSRR